MGTGVEVACNLLSGSPFDASRGEALEVMRLFEMKAKRSPS